MFKLSSCLGGLGRRSRRGFGSFSVVSESKSQDRLDYILELLDEIVSGNFIKDQHSIILNKNCNANYPFIRKIEIGREYTAPDKLLKKIAIASHEAAVKYPHDRSLGYTSKGKDNRLASPIYVSVIKSGNAYRPVITTLQLASKNDVGSFETEKQKYFKEAIL